MKTREIKEWCNDKNESIIRQARENLYVIMPSQAFTLAELKEIGEIINAIVTEKESAK